MSGARGLTYGLLKHPLRLRMLDTSSSPSVTVWRLVIDPRFLYEFLRLNLRHSAAAAGQTTLAASYCFCCPTSSLCSVSTLVLQCLFDQAYCDNVECPATCFSWSISITVLSSLVAAAVVVLFYCSDLNYSTCMLHDIVYVFAHPGYYPQGGGGYFLHGVMSVGLWVCLSRNRCWDRVAPYILN